MLRLLACLVLLLPLLSACGHDGTGELTSPDLSASDLAWGDQPMGSATSASYPLTIGNRWQYDRSFTATTLLLDDPTPMVDVVLGTRESEQTGFETWMGREYVLQEDRITEDVSPGETFMQRIYYRQDLSGLYEAEIPVTSLPGATDTGTMLSARRGQIDAQRAAAIRSIDDARRARAMAAAWTRLSNKLDRLHAALGAARGGQPDMRPGRPGGPMPGEITRLAYPLRPGQHWDIGHGFRSKVVGRDMIEVPAGRFPAWQVQIESDFFEPGDEVYLWFGRQGELAFDAHVSGTATDENGTEIGTVQIHESEELTDFDLMRSIDGQ